MRYDFALLCFSLAACFCPGHSLPTRDYDKLCPMGWHEDALARCKAPLSYTGPCEALLATDTTDDAAKAKLEIKCKVRWPLVSPCQQDFGAECPFGWIGLGGVCRAPALYSGKCATRARLTDSLQKQAFSTECVVRWPCQLDCEPDFQQACPNGWLLVSDVCVASMSSDSSYQYTGPCIPFAGLLNFTAEEKMIYADRCEVTFCKSRAALSAGPSGSNIIGGAQCDMDFTRPCPLGWIQIGTLAGHCYGNAYAGACRPVVSLDDLQRIGVAIFASRCGVRWPCRTNAPQSVPSRQSARSVSGDTISGPYDVRAGKVMLLR